MNLRCLKKINQLLCVLMPCALLICGRSHAMEINDSDLLEQKFKAAVELLKTSQAQTDSVQFAAITDQAKEQLNDLSKEGHEPSQYLLSAQSLFSYQEKPKSKVEYWRDAFLYPGSPYVFPERTEFFDQIKLDTIGDINELAKFNPRKFINERYSARIIDDFLFTKNGKFSQEWALALGLVLGHKQVGELALNVFNLNVLPQIPQFLDLLLPNSHSIISLHFSGPNISAQVGLMLADVIAKNQQLQELTFNKNNLSSIVIKSLRNALKNHKSIRHLEICENNLNDEAAEHLADILPHNQTLFVLNLYKNYIGDKGAKAIARALKEKGRLINLNLEDNPIKWMGLNSIFASLINNLSVKFCNLGDIGITQKEVNEFFEKSDLKNKATIFMLEKLADIEEIICSGQHKKSFEKLSPRKIQEIVQNQKIDEFIKHAKGLNIII